MKPFASWHNFAVAVMFAVFCSPISPSFAADVKSPQPIIHGAQSTPCAEPPFSAQASSYDACYTATPSDHLELRIDSARKGLTLNQVRYTVKRLDAGKSAQSSGQFLNGGGVAHWQERLQLPQVPRKPPSSPDGPSSTALAKPLGEKLSASQPGLYELRLEIEDAGNHGVYAALLNIDAGIAERDMKIWPIANTKAELLLPGCWNEKSDTVLALHLSACKDDAIAVKVASAKLVAGTLDQYVNNSVQAYTVKQPIWRIRADREIMDRGHRIRHLDVEQMLAGRQSVIQKYFFLEDESIVVVNLYTAPDAKSELIEYFQKPQVWLQWNDE